MPESMNIPQLTVLPAPAVSRGDEVRAVPDTPGTTPDTGTAARSFADVLKSKAAPTPEESAEDSSPQIMQDDASLLAAMGGIPVPAEIPLASQLLAQLKKEAPATLQPAIPAVSNAPETAVASLNTAELEVTAIPVSADGSTDAPLLAVPAIPAVLPISAIVPPTPSALPLPSAKAEALPPVIAPTKGQERSLTISSFAPGNPSITSSEVNAEAPGKRPMLAASAAISAEAGGRVIPEASTEFRPLLDRLTDHSGNVAAQVASPPMPSQQNNVVPEQLRITTPFAQAGWAQEVDQKLNWMVTNTKQQADLVLNPPDLGRIEVTLVVKGDEVNASFASPHQAVREAIEESLVRLRESLAESGINLGQTHVGRDSSQNAPFMKPEGDSRHGNGSRREANIALAVPLSAGTAWQPSRSRGMVDVFA